MATTTTPDSIYVLESSDPDEPLAWQPAMATSVQNALNSRALQTFRWANATERNAQVGMREGDMGIQEDTDVTYQYDTVTPNAWGQVLPVPPLPGRVIASGVVTAQSSIVIDGLTGGTEYEILLDLPTSSTANDLTARLRSGGVANTSSSYHRIRLSGSAGATSSFTSPVGNSWEGLAVNLVTDKLIRIKLSGLNQNWRTAGDLSSLSKNASSNESVHTLALWHSASVAFDGIEFNVTSGTVTGAYTARVW